MDEGDVLTVKSDADANEDEDDAVAAMDDANCRLPLGGKNYDSNRPETP